MAEQQEKASSATRILVLDDNASFTALLAMLLGEQGYQVDMALDGESALQMIAAKHYDVLLVDLNLPDIQGDAFIEIARQCDPAVKAVLVSANPDVGNYAKACKADGAFFKGESVMTLFTRVLSLLAQADGKQGADVSCMA
ncbi:MAG: response regulator [Armatimonadota bacterium]